MTMNNKKQNQPLVHKTLHETFRFLSILTMANRLKSVITTLSFWGWLPLGLANWILRKEKVREAFNFQAGSKPSKKIV